MQKNEDAEISSARSESWIAPRGQGKSESTIKESRVMILQTVANWKNMLTEYNVMS